MEAVAACMALRFAANGTGDIRHAYWLTAPAGKMLAHGKLHQPCAGWFYPTSLPRSVRLGADYLGLLGAAGGYRFPLPRALDLHAAERLAAWLHRLPRTGQTTMLTTTVSSAVRVALAASAAGIVTILREPPIATRAGKVLPFHLASAARGRL